MAGDPVFSIMLVDDEPGVINALKRLFFMENFTILTAGGGHQALDILRNTDGVVRLIISDQRMPEMTGAEFLEQSRQIFPYAPRFLLTAHSDAETLICAAVSGKPFVCGDVCGDGDVCRKLKCCPCKSASFESGGILHL